MHQGTGLAGRGQDERYCIEGSGSNREAEGCCADMLAQGEARGGMLTTVAALTQLLVAVHSITHDVQSQHDSTLLALHAMSLHLSQHCDVGGKDQLADCTAACLT